VGVHPAGIGVYVIWCDHPSHTEINSHRFLIDEGYAYVSGDKLFDWMTGHAHEEDE
jgi:hypothetical protein